MATRELGWRWSRRSARYRLILTLPDDMSTERRTLLSLYGAEIVLTPAIEGMSGAVFAAQELVRKHGYFMAQQFLNPANPEIHRQTTAREILEATDGVVDAVVVGVGTGGTITGVGEVLKKELKHTRPNLLIVAVEPSRAAVLSGGRPGSARHSGDRRWVCSGRSETAPSSIA